MLSSKKKLQLVGALAALLLVAAALGCNGFFVDPTLTTIAVGPLTPTILEGSTLQMTAVATYNDGSTKTLSGNGVFWSSSSPSTATVSTAGLVTGVTAGTSTISASSGAVSGQTSVTIGLNLTKITISPTNPSVPVGTPQSFSALGTLVGGGQQDVTGIVTWNSSNTTVATIDNTGTASTLTAGTTVITATSGNIVSNQETLTVTP